jgi:branched-chain amino acid transport system ATP-binding protein
VLEGKKVVKRFGGIVAVDAVDFRVEKGKITGLIGPNGSGKTTLFNVISGFFKPESGTMTFKGVSIVGKKPYQIARMGIGRTFQIVKPFPGMTILENVAVAALYGRRKLNSMEEALGYAEKWVEFCGLGSRARTPASEITLADTKRLEMARALAVEPEMILLDEPLGGLNTAEMNPALEMIETIRSKLGVTVFMIEHRMSAVMKICDQIILLHHGKKIVEGRPVEVARSPVAIEAYLGEPVK